MGFREWEARLTGQAIEVEADSLEEAKRLVRARVPEGLELLSEHVVSDGKPKTVTAQANTVEAALEKARGKVPGDAAVLETKAVTEPREEVVRAEAFSEVEVKGAIFRELKAGAHLRSVRLVAPGEKGFLGIGKTPNQYEGEVFHRAVVRLKHSTKAKIVARVGEITVGMTMEEVVRSLGAPQGGVTGAEILGPLAAVDSRASDEFLSFTTPGCDYSVHFRRGRVESLKRYPKKA